MKRSSSYLLVAAGLVAGEGLSRADTALNFFGDVDYHLDSEAPISNSFRASSLDIFATQTEGKFAFIGEMVVEAFGSNEFGIDVDRLEVSYRPTPWLHFTGGRLRSALGYYGDAYQNGKFFMTAASWPQMYEGDGFDGILPSHSIGLHADAVKELGGDNGKLTLDVEVLNGRATELDVVPAYSDENTTKAFNVRARYVGQDALEGLIVGGNVYLDDVPRGADHDAEHELILGAHAAYNANDVHFIAEGYWIRHKDHISHAVHDTVAAFGELGYTMGDFTPYGRYEYEDLNGEDAFFSVAGLEAGEQHLVSLGVKYAASASVAFKLQGGFVYEPDQTAFNTVAQAAFAF